MSHFVGFCSKTKLKKLRIKTKQDNIQGCSKRQGSCMAGNDEMLK